MKHPRKVAPVTIDDTPVLLAPVLLVRVVDTVLRLRVWLLGVCVVLALLAVGPASRLEFDRSLEGLFTPGDPRLVSYTEGKETFGGAETGVVAFTDPELLTSDGLWRLEQLDTSLQQVPGVEHVLSLAGARLPAAPLRSLSLREQLDNKSISPAELRASLLGNELYRNRLLSEDGQTTVLLVSFSAREADVAARDETIVRIRAICDAHQPPAVFAGGPVLVNDVYEHLEQDGRILGIVSSLVLAVVIAVLFRNLRWIVLPLAVVHLTLIWTKALLVVGGLRLSMVSSPLVALVTVIGTATVVHVTIRFREERKEHEPPEALRRTLIHIGPAIFWTCLTTAIGFSSLMASRVAPVGSFGGMMTLGAGLVFVAAMGLLPAGVLLGRYGTDPARAPGEQYVAALLDRLVAAVERHPWQVAGIGLGLLALTSVGIFKLEVATEFDENFRETSPIVESYHFIIDRMGTTETVDILVDVPEVSGRELDDFSGTRAGSATRSDAGHGGGRNAEPGECAGLHDRNRQRACEYHDLAECARTREHDGRPTLAVSASPAARISRQLLESGAGRHANHRASRRSTRYAGEASLRRSCRGSRSPTISRGPRGRGRDPANLSGEEPVGRPMDHLRVGGGGDRGHVDAGVSRLAAGVDRLDPECGSDPDRGWRDGMGGS